MFVSKDENSYNDVPDLAAWALLPKVIVLHQLHLFFATNGSSDEKLRSILIASNNQDDLSYLITDTGSLTHLKVTDKPRQSENTTPLSKYYQRSISLVKN